VRLGSRGGRLRRTPDCELLTVDRTNMHSGNTCSRIDSCWVAPFLQKARWRHCRQSTVQSWESRLWFSNHRGRLRRTLDRGLSTPCNALSCSTCSSLTRPGTA